MMTAFFACVLLTSLLISCAAPARAFDGHRLGDCPDSPNCVGSEMEPGQRAYVAPLGISDGVDPDVAFRALGELIGGRAQIVRQDDAYLHAVFTTRWLRFRDDLELRLDRGARVIHVRSASRLGRSDFGVNRRRVEELRVDFQACQA